jgi:hypothetical protein
MASFQRVLCGRVIFHGEGRWFEAVDCVATRTFGTACAFEELPAVIVLVTIHAVCKCNLRLEVPVLMTIFASHGFVLAE